jgi:GT2 family glycosyltransferase
LTSKTALISIVIVHYKVPDFLQRAMRSLKEARLYEQSEVIIVDNASQDHAKESIAEEFPEVQWIGLKSNIGFGKACNVGAKCAQGTFVLFLNPDTLVSHNALSECVHFYETNKRVGLIGPKILNPDGSLQVSCRRSFPTPPVALYRLAGLSRLFPKSKVFGQYNLTYLDPEKASEVDAVSGSFMFMPLALFQELGGFDESFFMYGEDLDLCWRVKEKGYMVWYDPQTQIIHFKGKSSEKKIFTSRKAFYEAMVIFSRKYRSLHKAFFPGWLINAAIVTLATRTIAANLLKTFTATTIDFVLINAVLFAGISVRFALSALKSPYRGSNVLVMIGMHALLTAGFISIFTYRGVYAKGRYSTGNTLISGALASMAFMSCLYFVKSMAFSRIAFLLSTICITLISAGWREGIPRIKGRFKKLIYSTGKVVVIGNDTVTSRLLKNLEEDKSAQIFGVLWPKPEKFPGEFMGYPVLGTIDDIRLILEHNHVDLLLIATKQPWYSYVIEALSSSKVKNLTIRWVPVELFSQNQNILPQVIPLHDFTV